MDNEIIPKSNTQATGISSRTANAADAPKGPVFLRVLKANMGFQAKSFRVQGGDILVAINGEIFQSDSAFLTNYFIEAINQADENDLPDPKWLLTFYRNGVFFNLLFPSPLIAKFDFCELEDALKIQEGFSKLHFSPIEAYESYEVFRDMEHRCSLHSTAPDPIATYVPALWMLQNNLGYPLAAILIIYGMTYLASVYMFIVAYILVGYYTKNARLNLLRSYQLYGEKFFWLTIAAENDEKVKDICFQFDNEASFKFTKNPHKKKKKKK